MQENRKMHWTEKIENPPLLLTKTENQRLIGVNAQTAHDTKTEKPQLLSTKTENKGQLAKSAKPKIQTAPHLPH